MSSCTDLLTDTSRPQDRTHKLDYYHPRFDVKEDHGTTHLSVVDQYGSAVSLTSTVNLLFGSRVMDKDTGIILNDEMVTLRSALASAKRCSPCSLVWAGRLCYTRHSRRLRTCS